MSLIVPTRRAAVRPVKRLRKATSVPADHDLPVLGMELDPPHRPEWESLLDAGVQPALLLGAERRLRRRG
jgi:hypothetical protein